MKLVRILAWVLAGAVGLIAVLFLGLASLGHLGILADVGEQENARIGQQAMRIGLGASGVTIVLLAGAWLLHRNTSAK